MSLVEKYFHAHRPPASAAWTAAGVQRELNERYDSALALEKSPSPEQLPTLGRHLRGVRLAARST